MLTLFLIPFAVYRPVCSFFAFGSVLAYVMILFLFPVAFSVLCSLLCCALMSVFCLFAYLFLLIVTSLISPFYKYYGMIGSFCVGHDLC